jgi:hypothetical protein
MKARQLYFVLLGCCLLATASLFGVAYGADQLLGKQARKLSNLRADSASASLQQTALTQDRKDIQRYSQLNTIAASVVPQDKDQAQAVQQIVNVAAASGIAKLSSITFPTSSLGTHSSSKLTQLTPVAGITGVYNLQITITLSGGDSSVPYDNFLQFLTGLEQNRRTAEVSSISVQPDSQRPGNVSFTLVVNEFIKP